MTRERWHFSNLWAFQEEQNVHHPVKRIPDTTNCDTFGKIFYYTFVYIFFNSHNSLFYLCSYFKIRLIVVRSIMDVYFQRTKKKEKQNRHTHVSEQQHMRKKWTYTRNINGEYSYSNNSGRRISIFCSLKSFSFSFFCTTRSSLLSDSKRHTRTKQNKQQKRERENEVILHTEWERDK